MFDILKRSLLEQAYTMEEAAERINRLLARWAITPEEADEAFAIAEEHAGAPGKIDLRVDELAEAVEDVGQSLMQVIDTADAAGQGVQASTFAIQRIMTVIDARDDIILDMAEVFADNEWMPDTRYIPNEIIPHKGVLYRMMAAEPIVSQAHQPPGSEGMLAVYRPIVQEHAGTVGDPIPFVYGMDVAMGKVYMFEDVLYTSDRDVLACVYYPGAAGVHFWTEVGV